MFRPQMPVCPVVVFVGHDYGLMGEWGMQNPQ
jgi:hypothetical protein